MKHMYLAVNKNNDFRIFGEKPEWSTISDCWVVYSAQEEYGFSINPINLAQHLQDLTENDNPVVLDKEFEI